MYSNRKIRVICTGCFKRNSASRDLHQRRMLETRTSHIVYHTDAVMNSGRG